MSDQTKATKLEVQSLPKEKLTKEGFHIGDAEELAACQIVQQKQPKQKKRRRDESCSEEEVLEGMTMDSISGSSRIKNSSKEQSNNLLSSIKQRQLQYHDDQGLNNRVGNNLKKSEMKIDDDRIRNKDKADRATLEQCLDPRTLIILEKWKNNKRIDELHGCISAGKEANVYLAQGTCDFLTMEPFPEGTPHKEFAIKVFKTSILVFKDRERYVAGEYRFRNGHCKGNPRKMVKLWAEKEVRNLKRLSLVQAIKCPVPHIFKNNVILMDFIGVDSVAAPRLKDASVSNWQDAYEQTLFAIRRMFQDAKLVHADLSEYNLLWFQDQLYVIDVSQAVELDHPMALDFLRRDCSIMNDFFSKKKLRTLNMQDTYEFVTDFSIKDAEAHLAEKFEELGRRGDTLLKEEEQKDNIFREMYIPRSVQELSLEDIYRLQKEGNDDSLTKFAKMATFQSTAEPVSLKEEVTGPESESMDAGEEEDESSSESSSSDEEHKVTEQTAESEAQKRERQKGISDMTKDERKEHKKKVKEENREKRKTKTPKHIKKRAENRNRK